MRFDYIISMKSSLFLRVPWSALCFSHEVGSWGFVCLDPLAVYLLIQHKHGMVFQSQGKFTP